MMIYRIHGQLQGVNLQRTLLVRVGKPPKLNANIRLRSQLVTVTARQQVRLISKCGELDGQLLSIGCRNIWHYRDENGHEITFEIVDTIEIQRSGGETIESFVLQKSSTAEGLENIVNYTYLGPRLDEKGEVSGIVQHAQNTTSGTQDTILFEPFLPLYQFPLIPGEKWDVNFQAKLVPELFPIGGGLDEFEVLSEETVAVPAGTFEHVFQVQESFRWGFDIGNQDFALDVTIVKSGLRRMSALSSLHNRRRVVI